MIVDYYLIRQLSLFNKLCNKINNRYINRALLMQFNKNNILKILKFDQSETKHWNN
jgi:hypothetical protein